MFKIFAVSLANLVHSILLSLFKRSYILANFDGSVKIGKNTYLHRATIVNAAIDDGVQLRGNNLVVGGTVGKYTYMQRGAMVTYANIGSYCSIAENARVGAPHHDIARFTTHELTFTKIHGFIDHDDKSYFERVASQRTTVGSDVWIGHGAVILPGVTVGHGAVVGAGAVVTKDVTPYEVVAGVPAKFVKWRFDEVTRDSLLKSRWWTLTPKIIRRCMNDGSDVEMFLRNFRI